MLGLATQVGASLSAIAGRYHLVMDRAAGVQNQAVVHSVAPHVVPATEPRDVWGCDAASLSCRLGIVKGCGLHIAIGLRASSTCVCERVAHQRGAAVSVVWHWTHVQVCRIVMVARPPCFDLSTSFGASHFAESHRLCEVWESCTSLSRVNLCQRLGGDVRRCNSCALLRGPSRASGSFRSLCQWPALLRCGRRTCASGSCVCSGGPV